LQEGLAGGAYRNEVRRDVLAGRRVNRVNEAVEHDRFDLLTPIRLEEFME